MQEDDKCKIVYQMTGRNQVNILRSEKKDRYHM